MNNNKGFSLIELMVVIAIVGVIASLAVPTFGDMIQRNQLKAAVQSFQNDMQFARGQAIKRSQTVLINRTVTSAAAGDWCYGLSANAACTCTTANSCEIKTVLGTNFSSVSMATEVGNNNKFNFRRGTIAGDGVTFYTTKYAARVKFSDTGRVTICAPTTYPTGTVALPSLSC